MKAVVSVFGAMAVAGLLACQIVEPCEPVYVVVDGPTMYHLVHLKQANCDALGPDRWLCEWCSAAADGG